MELVSRSLEIGGLTEWHMQGLAVTEVCRGFREFDLAVRRPGLVAQNPAIAHCQGEGRVKTDEPRQFHHDRRMGEERVAMDLSWLHREVELAHGEGLSSMTVIR